jgi:DNA-binding transcriptional ArsR family regulator
MTKEFEQDAIWNALGNPHRRRLIDFLRDGPQTTGALATAFPELSRYAVMQHLNVLVEAGLVLHRSEGRYRFNYLNPVPIQMIYERWMRPYAQQVGEQMVALERYVNKQNDKETEMEPTQFRVVRIEAELPLKTTQDTVFRALTVSLDDWWPLRSREDAKVVTEPGVGGRMYEDWGDGAGLLYGQWLVYDPPYRSVLMGTTWMHDNVFNTRNTDLIEQTDDGVVYKKSYVLWGMISEDVEARLRKGTGYLLEVLKDHVENR